MQVFSRMMTAKSRFTPHNLIFPTLRVGMPPVTLRVTPSPRPTPEETHSCRSCRRLWFLVPLPRKSLGNVLQTAVLSV